MFIEELWDTVYTVISVTWIQCHIKLKEHTLTHTHTHTHIHTDVKPAKQQKLIMESVKARQLGNCLIELSGT